VTGFQDGTLFGGSGVEVDLGGGNGTVSQKILNVFDVHTFFQQKAGKGMAEHVGRDPVENTGVVRVFQNHVPNALGGKLPVKFGDEEVRLVHIAAASHQQVQPENAQDVRIAEEDGANLPALAAHLKGLPVDAHVIKGQITQLAYAKTAGKQHFHDSGIPQPEEFPGACGNRPGIMEYAAELLEGIRRHFLVDGAKELMHF